MCLSRIHGLFFCERRISMKKVICIVAVMFLAIMVIGCASTSSSKFGSDTVSGLKGKAEGEIISQFGKPYKQSINSDGEKVLEYRQSSQDSGFKNTAIAITSFGVLSGEDSPYVDIMKIYLKDNMVVKSTFDQNVQGLLTLP